MVTGLDWVTGCVAMAVGVALVVLALSSAGIRWSIPQYQKDPAEGFPIFMGPEGRRFLYLVSVPPLVLFLASITFLVVANWIVCLVAVPLAMWVVGPLLVPLVVPLWVRPLCAMVGLFRR